LSEAPELADAVTRGAAIMSSLPRPAEADADVRRDACGADPRRPAEQRLRRLKKQRSQLDFEDLITRTADLLTKSDVGPWIHYKLDQGIDHILVDEAQDTSPIQWSVIQSLAEGFLLRRKRPATVRTLFAVGDEKQSIYSFQGARPERFSEESRPDAASGFRTSGQAFSTVRLPLSFRSTSDVLAAVDHIFTPPGMPVASAPTASLWCIAPTASAIPAPSISGR
jgi:ATP-dependent helicase/nuclease subunit A